jgi:tellurite resistance protein TehA-like permease
MSIFKSKLLKVPTPAAGLALGIASIGKLLELYTVEQYFTPVIALILLVLVLSKFVSSPKLLWQELAHPVLGSIMPTFAMTVMVISSQLPEGWGYIASWLWYAAVILHIAMLISFTYLQLKHFSIQNLVPSWFVPPVGLAVGALTCPGTETIYIAQYLLNFAIVMYFLLLPVMLFRLILLPMQDASKPTIAILAAPPNLCLAAYLTFVDQPSTLFVLVLMSFALLMTALVYMALFVLLRLPFSPAYAGFTFPLVISATAIAKACDFLAIQAQSEPIIQVLQSVAMIEFYIACVVVSYVAIRYLSFYNLLPLGRVMAMFTNVKNSV